MYWTEVFLPYTGGTEVLGVNLLAGLRARGHEFEIVTAHGQLDLPDEDDHEGVPVHRLPFLAAVTSRDVLGMAQLRRRVNGIMEAFAPDLIHVQSVGASLLFHLHAARRHRRPWIFTPHAPLSDQDTGSGTILGEALETADEIVCVSNTQRESILNIAPAAAPRTSVIHIGLDPPMIEPAPLPFDPPGLVTLGRHVRDKGLDIALSAFARLSDRFPDVRLTVIGDGPERPALERQATALNLGERIVFPGRVPEILPFLDAATLVVMPSRWDETFGIVALEAALMARPVVVTRAGALPEVVVDGETGLVVEKEDDAGVAEAIAFLLERPETAREMGRAARERALRMFGLELSIDRYDQLYRRLAPLASARAGR